MKGHVESIEQLEQLRLATIELAHRFGTIAFDFKSEVQNALDWVSNEAPRYWRQQLQLAERQLQEAQDNLAAMMATYGGRDKPPATEARKRVETLRRRVQLCEAKFRACKAASLHLQQAANSVLPCIANLEQTSEADLPTAAQRLKKWIAALNRYAEMAGPITENFPPKTSATKPSSPANES